ncbi:MAG: hypothetical protein HGA86_02945 [Anaerolineaceae bacterium]|nr:hypothetical protein [Anaerolineaceae bacterium]
MTNTTTSENIEMLRKRGVKVVITTSPRWQGRSFGIILMEAMLVAYAGLNRALSPKGLNTLVDEVQLKPEVIRLDASPGEVPATG